MVYPYCGVLLSNKKEHTMHTYNNMGKSQNHHAKWKKLDKVHAVWSYLYAIIYMYLYTLQKCKLVKSVNTGADGSVCRPDYSDVCICQTEQIVGFKYVQFHVFQLYLYEIRGRLFSWRNIRQHQTWLALIMEILGLLS